MYYVAAHSVLLHPIMIIHSNLQDPHMFQPYWPSPLSILRHTLSEVANGHWRRQHLRNRMNFSLRLLTSVPYCRQSNFIRDDPFYHMHVSIFVCCDLNFCDINNNILCDYIHNNYIIFCIIDPFLKSIIIKFVTFDMHHLICMHKIEDRQIFLPYFTSGPIIIYFFSTHNILTYTLYVRAVHCFLVVVEATTSCIWVRACYYYSPSQRLLEVQRSNVRIIIIVTWDETSTL